MKVKLLSQLIGAVLAGVVIASHASAPSDTMVMDGESLYLQHCASCHDGKVAKAPPMSLLQIMSGGSILRAMESGVMQAQSATMDSAQKRSVARFLTGMDPDQAAAYQPAPRCEDENARFDFSSLPDTEGWGVTRDNRRHYGPEVTELSVNTQSQLELKWALAFPEAMRALTACRCWWRCLRGQSERYGVCP